MYAFNAYIPFCFYVFSFKKSKKQSGLPCFFVYCYRYISPMRGGFHRLGRFSALRTQNSVLLLERLYSALQRLLPECRKGSAFTIRKGLCPLTLTAMHKQKAELFALLFSFYRYYFGVYPQYVEVYSVFSSTIPLFLCFYEG